MSAELSHQRHPRSLPTVEDLLRPDAASDALLRQLLAELEDLGCLLTPPGGTGRADYVNVTPRHQRGRILSVHAGTGRAEFQTNSWDRVGHLSRRFVHLDGGNKAAHPLESASDLCAVVEAARLELGFRGGPRSPFSR